MTSVLIIGTLTLGTQTNNNSAFAAAKNNSNGNKIIQELNQNSTCTFPTIPGFCNTIADAAASIQSST
ncbi:MAG: hypothetical protein M3044_08005, partial [Thermoproteota archaeon]|nr:hypothetical protein [Thermoproteota archaeon]